MRGPGAAAAGGARLRELRARVSTRRAMVYQAPPGSARHLYLRPGGWRFEMTPKIPRAVAPA